MVQSKYFRDSEKKSSRAIISKTHKVLVVLDRSGGAQILKDFDFF